MGSHGDVSVWLDSAGSELIDGGRNVGRRYSQRYFRGPQILLAAIEGGMLDAALIRQSAEPDDAVAWLTPVAQKASARWSEAGDPGIDTSVADGLVALGRSLGRPVSVFDVLEAVLGSGLGMLSHETRGCPFSIDKLLIAIRKRCEETTAGLNVSLRAPGVATGADSLGQKKFDEVLTSFGTNLTETAAKLSDGLYKYRLADVERVAGILGRLTRRNPLVVGNAGVGKTAVVEGLAKWMTTDSAPEWLKGMQVYLVSCSSLIAGAGYRGQLEERVQQLIDNAIMRKDMLLFFDEIHALADPSATGSSNLLGLFNQYLSRGAFRMIASCSSRQFDAHIRPNDAFLRRFEVVRLEEPDREQTISMVRDHLPRFREHYRLTVEDEAIEAIFNNCQRYMASRFFPDKAISTLDSACQRVRLQSRKDENAAAVVGVQTVLEVVSEETSIPISRLSEMEQAKLRGLDEYLEGRVFDQVRATNVMSRAIQSRRLGLKDPGRTGAAFLFVGPPGTGKTELAKAVADYVMGTERALVRFNMSEFQTAESYQRLIGPPPGYVGYEEGGELTNRLTENPYSVVLFDEIEKGSNRVFDVFLQVLSDGHLKDSHGRVVDCKNSVFIMTSNALADVGEYSDNDMRQMLLRYQDPYKAQIGPTFRREFIDRLEIVPFDSLSDSTLKKIMQREINRVLGQVNSSEIMNCEISVNSAAMEWLIAKVDSASTGARSVQRLVESAVSRLISDSFIKGQIEDRGKYLVQVGGENQLVIEPHPSS